MSRDFAHSPYAEQRRELKAVAIETVVAAQGYTAADVRGFESTVRIAFERMAGVRPASLETWDNVAELLESAEQSVAGRVGS